MEPGVGPHEDARRPRLDEEVDERLRERQVDLRDLRRRPLAPVETRIVDVDVQAVLVRDMAWPERASARPAEVPDAEPRRAGLLRRILGRDAPDKANQIVGPPAAP